MSYVSTVIDVGLDVGRALPAAKPARSVQSTGITARYDAAQTTPALREHWAMADGLSADAANSPGVRDILRRRSRYECDNNPHVAGMIRTVGNDVVGTGPRLQVLLDDPEVNRIIADDWKAWAKESRFGKKIRLLRETTCRDGESVALFTTNKKFKHIVKLNLKPIECDRLHNPYWTGLEDDEVDGVRFDEDGNEVAFCILKKHPGGLGFVSSMLFDWVPAPLVIHMFSWDRPEQHRGIPELTPSMPLGACARGFRVATLDAARFAAGATAIIEGSVLPEEPTELEGGPLQEIRMPHGAALKIPNGMEIKQMTAEHPTTTYKEYSSSLVTEQARPICMPENIATGSSAGYNYSSATADRETWGKAVEIDQDDLEHDACDRTFDEWWLEYREVAPNLPEEVRQMDCVPHEWHWDQSADLDQVAAATARDTNLKSGMTSYQTEYAKLGRDSETEHRKQAASLGVTYEQYQGMLRQQLFPTLAPVAPAMPRLPFVNQDVRDQVNG